MRYAALSTHLMCRYPETEPRARQRPEPLGNRPGREDGSMANKLPRRQPPQRRRSDKDAPTPKPVSTDSGKDRKDIRPPWRPGLIPKDKS